LEESGIDFILSRNLSGETEEHHENFHTMIVDVRFEVFTAVTMKKGVFWVGVP
jgi:hypothetical protein